jgi:mRNA deadenylase 3'-5' endonuclease subunit Ccr4
MSKPTPNSSQNRAASISLPESDPVSRVFTRSDHLVALIRTKCDPTSADDPIVIQLPIGAKMLNFRRKPNDALEQVLQRMRISCAKALKEANTTTGGVSPDRKKTKNDDRMDSPTDISFISSDGSQIATGELSTVVKDTDTIRINTLDYKVVLDPPLCSTLSIDTTLFSGFPAIITGSFEGADESEFILEYRIIAGDSDDVLETAKIDGYQYIFTPEDKHVGNFLEVKCYHPRFPEFYQSVISPERICRFEGQIQSRLSRPLPPTDSQTVRVSTFNILAQPYIRTALAQDIYYTHLHKCWHLTEWSRRCPLILREMLDTDSDIYCLQEVAGGAHEAQIRRALSTSHDFHFFGKASVANNGNPIGVSISLRRSKFEVIESHRWNLGHGEDSLLLSMLSEGEKQEIKTKFGDSFFETVLKGIHTVAGVVRARHVVTNKEVLIANTHLFFHPFGGHVRILQGVCLMRKLAELRAAHECQPGVIVCGDFNSRPDSGSFEVMNAGKIDALHTDWQFGKSFRFDKLEEDEAGTSVVEVVEPCGPTTGIDLTHNLAIEHIPSTIPELTHATASFRSTLDYIFYTKDVFEGVDGEDTGSSIPQLTNAEADRMGGLPFDHYGSDHVLVSGDLSIRTSSNF